MGSPSPATDYIEDSICLNRLFILHPLATSLVEFSGLQYVVDSSVTPGSGFIICYVLFGEMAIGKMVGRAIITPESDSTEGEALSEVIVIGTVVLTITQHHEFNGPTI